MSLISEKDEERAQSEIKEPADQEPLESKDEVMKEEVKEEKV